MENILYIMYSYPLVHILIYVAMATLKASQTTYAEMFIIISVCICLDYEAWYHIPLITDGGSVGQYYDITVNRQY